MPNLSFSGVKKAVKGPIPEGAYLFVISDVVHNRSKSNEGDVYALTLQVDSPGEVNGMEVQGRTVKHWLYIADDGSNLPYARSFFEALMGSEEISDVDTDNYKQWVGEKVGAVVVHNHADDGKTYANIDDFVVDPF